MACGLDKNFHFRKRSVYGMGELDLHYFFRNYLRNNEPYYPIVRRYKIMIVHQDRYMLVLWRQFGIHSYDMDTALWKMGIGVFKYIGTFLYIERRNGMRNINNFGIHQFFVNCPLYGPYKMIFISKISGQSNYRHRGLLICFWFGKLFLLNFVQQNYTKKHRTEIYIDI